jgi:hypothetical protein
LETVNNNQKRRKEMQIKDRNIAMCILLTFITCGIYGLYWMYKIIEESDAVTGNDNPMNPVLVILLGVITCGIYYWFWLYQCGKRFDELNSREGRSSSGDYAVLFLILAIFELAIVDFAIIQSELNKRANC